MVYKRYTSPFETPVANNIKKSPVEIENKDTKEENVNAIAKEYRNSPMDFINSIGYDDLILVGLIVILLMDNKEERDVPLILALGFLFLVQYLDAD